MVVFPGFHFCPSVLQTHNKHEYGSCLSDQLKNGIFCKNYMFGDFQSKFWLYFGQKIKKWSFLNIFFSVFQF